MPSWISKGGEFHPAKEKIGLTNKSNKSFTYDGKEIAPGEPFVYDGPDREAIKVLHESGEIILGKNFKKDPDFLQHIVNIGFDRGEKGVDDYLKFIGYDQEKADKEFEEKASTVTAHEIPKRAKQIKELGGGRDFSGNKQDVYGGFGELPV